MSELVRVKLHGELGATTGQEEWNLHVNSAGEAIHAINSQTNDSIRRYFLEGRLTTKYKVLINKEMVEPNGNLTENELSLERNNLKNIDIIPLLEGSDLENPWWAIGLGVIGLGFASSPFAIMAALSILTQGLSNLLSKPPKLPDQRQMTNPSSDPKELANSYLFSGPANVINEGGPVPLGYGRLVVGSQVIMTSYDVRRMLTSDAGHV